MAIVYKPVCKYDTAGQGYDESAYDIGRLTDSISLGVADTKATSGSLALAETFSITDGIHYIVYLTEAFSIVDSAIKSGIRNLSESLGIVDSKTTFGNLAKVEGFGIVDSAVKNGIKNLAETLSVIDTKLFRVFFTETFSIIDGAIKNGIKNLTEGFSITDGTHYIVYLTESFSIIDSSIRSKIMKIRKIAIRFMGGKYESDIELED